MTSAVVFGYGDVGIRCLATLLAHDVAVPLVVTHEDDPQETQWFGSLARYASERDIPIVLTERCDAATLMARTQEATPDFIFSFYYRRLLPAHVLQLASRGALNLHGSLLPQFRGRAPINWAILHGATQTGATLHYMTERADSGPIVAQRAVPILPDDLAIDVFRKVCTAAELLMLEMIPALIAGTAPRLEQDIRTGRYYGARRPADGIIDWTQSAQRIHDLVRAVAPPYPGASTHIGGLPARVLRTLRVPGSGQPGTLFASGEHCHVICGDGRTLRLLELELEGRSVELARLADRLALTPARMDAFGAT